MNNTLNKILPFHKISPTSQVWRNKMNERTMQLHFAG